MLSVLLDFHSVRPIHALPMLYTYTSLNCKVCIFQYLFLFIYFWSIWVKGCLFVLSVSLDFNAIRPIQTFLIYFFNCTPTFFGGQFG